MNNQKIALLAIPVFAAVLIGATLTPAFAAEKVVDIKDLSVTVLGPFPGVCSVNPELVVIRDHIVFKLWDNGHFKSHVDEQVLLIDTVTGAITFEADTIFNAQGGPGDLPFSQQFNIEEACTDGSNSVSFHTGFTFDELGNFHQHGP